MLGMQNPFRDMERQASYLLRSVPPETAQALGKRAHSQAR